MNIATLFWAALLGISMYMLLSMSSDLERLKVFTTCMIGVAEEDPSLEVRNAVRACTLLANKNEEEE